MASMVHTVSSVELRYAEEESSSMMLSEEYMCDVPLDKLKEIADGDEDLLLHLKYNTTHCLEIVGCPIAMYNSTGPELIEYISFILGDQHYSYSFVIPFIVIVGLLVLVGFLGNLFTIIVIFRNRVLQTSSHYLVSMAFSDLLILSLTGMMEIAYELRAWPWVYSEFLCRARFYLIESCTFTTVLNISAFTCERYLAICHPIKAKTLVSKSRATKIIVFIWCFSFTVCLPLFLAYHAYEVCPGIPETMFCYVRDESWNKRVDNFYIFSATVLFLIPMAVITVLYSLIARVLYASGVQIRMRRTAPKNKNKLRRNGSIQEDPRKQEDTVEKTRRQIVKMLALVALCFAICWLPFHIIRVMPNFSYNSWSEAMLKVYHEGLYYASIVLLYTSSTINPILYNVMSARFRQAFRRTILCQDCSAWRSPPENARHSVACVTMVAKETIGNHQIKDTPSPQDRSSEQLQCTREGQATIPSIFSNDAQHARQPAPALFEAAGQITDDDVYIPPGGATEIMTPTNVEGAVEEDYSDLLNIDEDIDQLMLVTSPTKKPSQIPSTKPSVTAPKPGTKPPLTAPKPGTKPPITAPKPGAKPSVTTPKPGTKQTFNAPKSGTTTGPPNATQKPQSSPSKPTPKPRTKPKPDQSSPSEAVTDMTDNSVDAMLELGDGDILKYIQENENTEEATLDLF